MSDLIERQAAIDATWFEPSYTDPLNVLTEARDRLKALPSAEPKKGKWIDFSMSIKGVPTEACGVCGEWSFGMGKNFCPNCGADMRGEE